MFGRTSVGRRASSYLSIYVSCYDIRSIYATTTPSTTMILQQCDTTSGFLFAFLFFIRPTKTTTSDFVWRFPSSPWYCLLFDGTLFPSMMIVFISFLPDKHKNNGENVGLIVDRFMPLAVASVLCKLMLERVGGRARGCAPARRAEPLY